MRLQTVAEVQRLLQKSSKVVEDCRKTQNVAEGQKGLKVGEGHCEILQDKILKR